MTYIRPGNVLMFPDGVFVFKGNHTENLLTATSKTNQGFVVEVKLESSYWKRAAGRVFLTLLLQDGSRAALIFVPTRHEMKIFRDGKKLKSNKLTKGS